MHKQGLIIASLCALTSSISFADLPTSYFADFNNGLPLGWVHTETSEVFWQSKGSGLYGNALSTKLDGTDSQSEVTFSATTEVGRLLLIYRLDQLNNRNATFVLTINDNTALYNSWDTNGYITFEASLPAGDNQISFKLLQDNYYPANAEVSIDSIRFIADSIDSDKDFMEDSWEVTHGLDNSINSDANLDTDNDGLLNQLEYWYQTDPNNSDSDLDNLNDRYEVLHGLNPLDGDDADLDLDSDGLTNAEEFSLSTNPTIADSDADGLNDFDEVNTHGTNPRQNDTDGDGYRDGYEISVGTDPLDQGSHPIAIKKLHETFESTLGSQWQDVEGNIAFERVEHTAYMGEYGLMPGSNYPSQNSAIRLVENFDQGKLQFKYRLNSQSPSYNDYYSNLIVTKSNGTSQNTYNHSQNWEILTTTINQGTDYIQFDFNTDSNWQNNNEVVIDEVRFLSVTLDADGDLMDDQWEITNFLNPKSSNDSNIDADNDGLSNQDEYWSATSPFNEDSDDDGLPDGWEVNHGLNPSLSSDAALDLDDDTLTNLQEYEHGSHPLRADTDSDGLLDAAEINTHKTNPASADTDSDGLDDYAEITGTIGTNATIADSDNDGFLDGGEVKLGFDPTDSNSLPTAIVFVKENFNDHVQSTLTENPKNPNAWTYKNNESNQPWNYQFSTSVSAGQSSSLTWKGYFLAGKLSFNVSTDYAQVELIIDGVTIQKKAYGNFNHTLTEGAHSIQIKVTTNYSDNIGNAYLDNLHYLAFTRDLDNNQLDDNWQYAYGLGQYNYDSDEDNISDSSEYWLGTNPIASDSDDDGMPDGFEYNNKLNPLDAADADGDLDADGLTNAQEYAFQSYIDRADSDWDGLSDYDEATLYFTALNSSDTDNDSLDDGAEVLAYLTSPTHRDTDGDSFEDAVEIRNASDPLDKDDIPEVTTERFYSFESGLPSDFALRYGSIKKVTSGVVNGKYALSPLGTSAEFEMRDIFADIVVSLYAESNDGSISLSSKGNSEYMYQNKSGILSMIVAQGEDTIRIAMNNSYGITPPTIDALSLQLLDQDGDKIPNYWENVFNLNPFDPADGLLDFDSDGLNNADEYLTGTLLNQSDSDQDGLPDGWERNHGTKPIEADALLDYDFDALSNIEELEAGTHPLMADSDQDGLPDGWELKYGLDPNNSDSGSDKDEDGSTNLEEFLAGTNPIVKNAKENKNTNAGSFGFGIAFLLIFITAWNRRTTVI